MSNKVELIGKKVKPKRFMPIAKPDLPSLESIKKEVKQILDTGMITNHDFVKRFENAVADYIGVKHAVCVSSGTSGLMLAAKALGLKGDVIVPSFTFSATTNALRWCNLNPIFVDINKETFNIDTDKIREAITPKTSAIVPVHVFGNICDIGSINKIAEDLNLKVIFDSAHAFGAKYKEKMIGNFGNVEVFSLTPTKILTAMEGGVVTTNYKEVNESVILNREYGKTPDYDCKTLGLSARMGEFNAILGFHNLKQLERRIRRRDELSKVYRSELEHTGGIIFQKLNRDAECSLKDFAIVIDEKEFGMDRDKVAEILTKEGIGWRKYFYPPVHKETVNKDLESSKKVLPNTDYISENILNLPFFTSMTNEDVIRICKVIKGIRR